ncbi:MAG: hypothetical protein AB1416_08295, partial [Actinomycetota bacterium]
KVSTVEGPAITVPPGEVASAVADCPAGQRATGGGFFSSVAFTAGSVPGTTRWAVIVANTTTISVNVNAYVVCVAP